MDSPDTSARTRTGSMSALCMNEKGKQQTTINRTQKGGSSTINDRMPPVGGRKTMPQDNGSLPVALKCFSHDSALCSNFL